MIILGCALLAAGYVLFISPYNIVPGGVYGAGIVLHNLFPEIKIGTFGYMFDTVLLVLAFISFGPRFGSKTVVAALLTPGLMNLFTRLAYPTEEAMQSLDPSLMLGGILDMSDHLTLADELDITESSQTAHSTCSMEGMIDVRERREVIGTWISDLTHHVDLDGPDVTESKLYL